MHCRSGFKKGATSCPPTFNWAPAIPNKRFFQRSESPRNISGSSEILDLSCMLNHFSAKLPKLSKLMIGGHGPNICIEIGAPANCIRAEGCLHGWGKGLPVQKATPVPQERPTLETNSLKFQGSKSEAKVHLATPRGRISSIGAKVRPQFTYSFRIDELGPRSGGEGAQGGGG